MSGCISMGHGGIRDPTESELKKINEETQELGIGEFEEYAYVEALAKKPKYSEFPGDEGKQDHADMKKFAEWVMQRGVGAIVEERRGAAERNRRRRNVYRWGRIWIPDKSRGKSRSKHF